MFYIKRSPALKGQQYTWLTKRPKLWSAVTGRLKLFARCLALVRFSRLAPFLGASIHFRFGHAYDLLHKPLEAFKGFLVWRFGFFHLFIALAWLFECDSLIAKDQMAGHFAVVHVAEWQRVFPATGRIDVLATRVKVQSCSIVIQFLNHVICQDEWIKINSPSHDLGWSDSCSEHACPNLILKVGGFEVLDELASRVPNGYAGLCCANILQIKFDDGVTASGQFSQSSYLENNVRSRIADRTRRKCFGWFYNVVVISKSCSDTEQQEATDSPPQSSPQVGLLPVSNRNSKKDAYCDENQYENERAQAICLSRTGVTVGALYCFGFGVIVSLFFAAIISSRRHQK